MKIVTIVGARPQFIKSVPVSKELLNAGVNEILVHTGQHFDENMSDIFFRQLGIRTPDYLLNINNLNHGAMTGQMMQKIETILLKEKSGFVIVYGDTNSTLAGALTASKLGIKIIHIEAGLRSFNMKMPEEINRIITDRLSNLLFCPTKTAVKNLEAEGFRNFDCKINYCGDVMLDSVLLFTQFSQKPSVKIPDDFILCTLHRQENVEDDSRLESIFKAFNEIAQEKEIILPIHPRTAKKISKMNFLNSRLKLIAPIGYLEMLYLLKNCSFVFTDSGGLQKEAYMFKKMCLTVRDETEWIELVEGGFNFISGSTSQRIIENYKKLISAKPDFEVKLFGNGTAANTIVNEILK